MNVSSFCEPHQLSTYHQDDQILSVLFTLRRKVRDMHRSEGLPISLSSSDALLDGKKQVISKISSALKCFLCYRDGPSAKLGVCGCDSSQVQEHSTVPIKHLCKDTWSTSFKVKKLLGAPVRPFLCQQCRMLDFTMSEKEKKVF